MPQKLLTITIGLLTLLSACSTMQEVDQSLLNHPAMDLSSRLTPEKSSYLSPLGSSSSQAKNGGACLTCAHE